MGEVFIRAGRTEGNGISAGKGDGVFEVKDGFAVNRKFVPNVPRHAPFSGKVLLGSLPGA